MTLLVGSVVMENLDMAMRSVSTALDTLDPFVDDLDEHCAEKTLPSRTEVVDMARVAAHAFEDIKEAHIRLDNAQCDGELEDALTLAALVLDVERGLRTWDDVVRVARRLA